MNKKHYLKYITIFAVFIMCGISALTLYLERIVFPRGAEVLHSYAETGMFEVLNSSIIDVMDRYDADYNDLLDISYDNSGVINSVQVDYNTVNKIKSEISLMISDKLSKLDGVAVDVPIGAFSNNMYFMGKGPNIKFHLVQRGCVQTDFEHIFEGAGVNQVMHTLKIKLNADIALILPFYNTHTCMETSAIIAQIIINGETPHQYLDINKGGE